MKVDTARIMRKVVAQDPEFASRASGRLRKRIGGNLADAAFLRAAADRPESWRLLQEAIAEAGISRNVIRAAARLLVPEPAVSALRRWRRARA